MAARRIAAACRSRPPGFDLASLVGFGAAAIEARRWRPPSARRGAQRLCYCHVQSPGKDLKVNLFAPPDGYMRLFKKHSNAGHESGSGAGFGRATGQRERNVSRHLRAVRPIVRRYVKSSTIST
jgi:hypothetical protein